MTNQAVAASDLSTPMRPARTPYVAGGPSVGAWGGPVRRHASDPPTCSRVSPPAAPSLRRDDYSHAFKSHPMRRSTMRRPNSHRPARRRRRADGPGDGACGQCAARRDVFLSKRHSVSDGAAAPSLGANGDGAAKPASRRFQTPPSFRPSLLAGRSRSGRVLLETAPLN